VEERLDIDTPESVIFDYRVAGVGSRFMAALVDTTILGVLLTAFVCGIGAITSVAFFNSTFSALILALAILFIFALIWGYYIFFEVIWNGQSPGKRWVGLRVIRTDGMPITLVDSVIRNLVRVIDFLPFYYGVGLLTMFLNAQARRLGDYAAGTIVVKGQRGVTLESVQRTIVSAPGPPTAVSLSAKEYRLVTEYLNRRHELSNREEMAQRIAAVVATKLGLPRPVSAREAEDFLDQLARQSRRQ
jgi:uncharacterized RDD family membrane protein YckC